MMEWHASPTILPFTGKASLDPHHVKDPVSAVLGMTKGQGPRTAGMMLGLAEVLT